LIGYRQVMTDRLYLGFIGASMLMGVVYIQMYNTLSVYLRDVHGIPERGYGLMLSLNALTVVVLQFWTTRRTRGRPPMLMMALGTLLYLVGFTMYGIVSTYALFIFAMIWITFGEMISVPVGQALVARFAPEDMRGRYMAFYGLAWAIPGAVGPWAAGIVLDNYNPDWVWYIGGILCALSIAGFLALHAGARARLEAPAEQQEAALPL
jgi:MFS family permease